MKNMTSVDLINRGGLFVTGVGLGGFAFALAKHHKQPPAVWVPFALVGSGMVASSVFGGEKRFKKFHALLNKLGRHVRFSNIVHPSTRLRDPKKYPFEEDIRKNFKYVVVGIDGSMVFSKERPPQEHGMMLVPPHRLDRVLRKRKE
jgi:hypothetical protein